MVAKLNWDSDFFNISIGELIQTNEAAFESDSFDLVYVKINNSIPVFSSGFENTFSETKVIFHKKLGSKSPIDRAIISLFSSQYSVNDLYELAYESGKFSRFKLDPRFGEPNFRKLYKAWVDNSINKSIADDVLVYKELDRIIGFVTYKIKGNAATIGLIAVSSDFQGKGIGKKLVESVQNAILDKDRTALQIPTQLENTSACLFYEKLGYKIIETTFLTHFWKR